LDDKKNIHPDYDQYVQVAEAPPLTSQELHLSYKASQLMENINRARLCECLSGMSKNDPNYAALIKKSRRHRTSIASIVLLVAASRPLKAV